MHLPLCTTCVTATTRALSKQKKKCSSDAVSLHPYELRASRSVYIHTHTYTQKYYVYIHPLLSRAAGKRMLAQLSTRARLFIETAPPTREDRQRARRKVKVRPRVVTGEKFRFASIYIYTIALYILGICLCDVSANAILYTQTRRSGVGKLRVHQNKCARKRKRMIEDFNLGELLLLLRASVYIFI